MPASEQNTFSGITRKYDIPLKIRSRTFGGEYVISEIIKQTDKHLICKASLNGGPVQQWKLNDYVLVKVEME